MHHENFISTKRFVGFPCTHRQWKADSHCKFIHGYSREFYIEFECNSLTHEGWVVDFGGLKDVKTWLDGMFDHTFLVSEDDPHMAKFLKLDSDGIVQLRVLPNSGMEGTAKFVFDKINQIINEKTSGRAWVRSVEVNENEKNSAIYNPNSHNRKKRS